MNEKLKAGDRMKGRIALWALAGLAVASFWVVLAFLTPPNPALGRSALVIVTAPAALVGRAVPLAYYWFILLNIGVYILAGFTVELLRAGIVGHLPG